MRVTGGSASIDVSQGKRRGWLSLTRGVEWSGWYWEVGREADGVPFLLAHGKVKTWAEAYRRGMRAAERLLAKEAP